MSGVKKSLNESTFADSFTRAPEAGEYSSSDFNDEFVYAKNFMMWDSLEKRVTLFGYNSFEDFCDLFGIDIDDYFYSKVDALRVGESEMCKVKLHGSNIIITRLQ